MKIVMFSQTQIQGNLISRFKLNHKMDKKKYLLIKNCLEFKSLLWRLMVLNNNLFKLSFLHHIMINNIPQFELLKYLQQKSFQQHILLIDKKFSKCLHKINKKQIYLD